MAQSAADIWNESSEMQTVRENLGFRALDADDEHATYEMRATDLNKFREYWAGGLLQFLVEATANNLVNGPTTSERGRLSFDWYGTHVSTLYLGNSRSETVICESRWEVRDEQDAVVVSTVRDGDAILLSATSSYARR